MLPGSLGIAQHQESLPTSWSSFPAEQVQAQREDRTFGEILQREESNILAYNLCCVPL